VVGHRLFGRVCDHLWEWLVVNGWWLMGRVVDGLIMTGSARGVCWWYQGRLNSIPNITEKQMVIIK